MSGAHTPGPWVWRWKSGSLHQVGTERPYGATVLAPTHEYEEGVDVEVSDADAALIEAAPNLLAALISLLNRYVEMANSGDCGFWEPEREQQVLDARAAIAKATGEKA